MTSRVDKDDVKWALGDKGLFRFHRYTFTFTFAGPMSRVCALLMRARDACDAGPCLTPRCNGGSTARTNLDDKETGFALCFLRLCADGCIWRREAPVL